jgi:hypothetical protein
LGAQATLAKILLSDATDKICADVFSARGHAVDSKPGLSKDELKKIIGEYDGEGGREGGGVWEGLLALAEPIHAALRMRVLHSSIWGASCHRVRQCQTAVVRISH